MALDEDGDFVVVWESLSAFSYHPEGIAARRFNAAGVAQGAALVIDPRTSSAFPSVAMDGDGDFVVAWSTFAVDGDSYGVFARRFDSSGAGSGATFQVNRRTVGSQGDASASMDHDGNFVIVWSDYDPAGADGSSVGVFARLWSAAGLPGDEFQVNGYTPGGQAASDAAMDADGDFVVAWQDSGRDGSSTGIFARRFVKNTVQIGIVLDIDDDGMAAPLTDGLLVLRYLFGFRGATLVAGAVSGSCGSRCSAAAIENYIASFLSALDVDDDGSPQPLTDGLLVLRYLFGFRGATLTSGAVSGSCGTRCNAAAIEAYLATLL